MIEPGGAGTLVTEVAREANADHVGIARGKLANDLGRTVGGTIIDEDDAAIGADAIERLGQPAMQLGKICFLVQQRDDDGDQHGGSCSPICSRSRTVILSEAKDLAVIHGSARCFEDTSA